MNHKTVMIAIFITLAGCSEGSDESKNTNVQESSGMFSGSVAGKEYEVGVNCSDFDKDYFRFLSDRTDVSDTNGDGIIISGMENNGKLVLTVIDNGKTFSAGNVNFTKGDNKAEGSGKLFEEGATLPHDVKFTVMCG